MRLCVNLGNFHAKNSFQFSLKIIVRSQHSLLLVLRRNGRRSLETFLSNILTIVMRLIKYYLAPFALEYVCNLQPDSFNSHRTKFFLGNSVTTQEWLECLQNWRSSGNFSCILMTLTPPPPQRKIKVKKLYFFSKVINKAQRIR